MTDPLRTACEALVRQWRKKADWLSSDDPKVRGDFYSQDAMEECADQLTAALAEAVPAAEPASPWQPIETAPKDGTRMLLYPGPNGYSVVGRRSLIHHAWECLPGKYSIQPTYWMPLSAQPLEADAASPSLRPPPVAQEPDR